MHFSNNPFNIVYDFVGPRKHAVQCELKATASVSALENSAKSSSAKLEERQQDRQNERQISRDAKEFKTKYFVKKVLINSANGIIYEGLILKTLYSKQKIIYIFCSPKIDKVISEDYVVYIDMLCMFYLMQFKI